ncbi:anti-sigma regulatory factor (Ser/Thr protein kinase) [Catenuloplanes nepalensis]|uniref:Anti-sigma regulatory factor (Ser/Thr protein kinase) n=1 Tax=Catenuloplanes nepalensis TaxID=587533 RepID=A0ABT9MS18_9ACTN|nr:ATP-binding protein [Catenuloplanes nepalensis]MDP9794179.1 anti-sigma regulatory factor (Ser/Thr protein kinase) [Catenuloplanes nepalensis]
MAFTAADLPRLRSLVTEVAGSGGLGPEAVTDWVSAVNELLINAIRHGGGTGRLRLWAGPPVACEVSDRGCGFDAVRYERRTERPALSASGGLGLWLARQLTHDMRIRSGRDGTTVRVVAHDRAHPSRQRTDAG